MNDERKAEDGNLCALVEEGWSLLKSNDERGHEVMARASTLVLGRLCEPVSPDPAVAKLFEYILTAEARKVRGPLTSDKAAELTLRWYSPNPHLLWRLAEREFRKQNWLGASELLQHLICMGQSGTYDHSVEFDPVIVGDHARLNLGKCFIQLEKFDNAEGCFLALMEHPRLGEEARRYLAVAQQVRGLKRTEAKPQTREP
jgi:hypothetical protein